MNTRLFCPNVADHNRLTLAKRSGATITFCEHKKLLAVDGVLLGYPANLGTRAKALEFADLHNFILS